MESHWDVIIVGARCAGGALGALLAKQGLRTLLLEASPRGTDMPMSTHLVQPPGMDVLDRIGVGDRVRAVTPASPRFRFAMDDAGTIITAREGRTAYCVRRSVVDPWLQDAAENAGAELRDRHTVVDLVREGDRVAGVVARGPGGTVTLRADLVVGADGVNSTIAKLTGVEEYLVAEGERAGYWGYFPAPETWDREWDSTLEHRGKDVRYVFRCDGGVVALVYMGEQSRVTAWGRDYRQRFTEALQGSDVTRTLAEGKEPVGKLLGLLKTRFFYRRPVGPGFALIGDAGHFKDFVTGQGMTDAFLDAERLSRAVIDGRPEAFERYWRERDVATLPLHFDALRQGRVGFNDAFMRFVISRLAARPDLRQRMTEVVDRKITPGELLAPRTLVAWMGAALVSRRFDVISAFLRAGRALGVEAKELAARTRLLEQARRTLESARPTEHASVARHAA